MKIILLQDIKGVGKKDQVINASDGYARNYLLPKKLGLEANTVNMKLLKDKQDSNNRKRHLELESAKNIAKEIENMNLQITVKAGENGKIFGSVTSKEISEELKKQNNIEADKKKIVLKEPIKTLGGYIVDVKLYEGVTSKLKINLVAE